MVDVKMTVDASPERVFEVLADGWTYAAWVVGASHIRDVDAGWPARGTRIHHCVGSWPLLLDDVTKVHVADPPRLLELDARAWPFGTARIRLELRETAPGTTEILMSEQATRGPGRLLPEAAQALFLVPRNRESLRRLADLAKGREAAQPPA
ncbi:SRPBCC family protein [Amycolatopsis roodepoortensis]|uniref:SRPBCC family protein n=1 Tax=Amycolatopsis roodepoortensis TaxID=700274 RepID=UPI00214B01D6|nr:SRPBCC family protein [Amycolatopsis roodepoortensis]UUV30920.1 SRPBCC family protein [Amycolatopsis roodepoortensis]